MDVWDNDVCVVAISGGRELYLMARTNEDKARAYELLASHTFDKLYRAGKRGPGAVGRYARKVRVLEISK